MDRTCRKFHSALIVAIVLATSVHAGPLTLTTERVVPWSVVVTYNSADGNLSFDGNGYEIYFMELKSDGRLFDPSKAKPWVIAGPFDVLKPDTFFKLIGDGYPSLDLGPILPPGLPVPRLC